MEKTSRKCKMSLAQIFGSQAPLAVCVGPLLFPSKWNKPQEIHLFTIITMPRYSQYAAGWPGINLILSAFSCPSGATMSPEHTLFNKHLSKSRVTLEHTLGLLKDRFPKCCYGLMPVWFFITFFWRTMWSYMKKSGLMMMILSLMIVPGNLKEMMSLTYLSQTTFHLTIGEPRCYIFCRSKVVFELLKYSMCYQTPICGVL